MPNRKYHCKSRNGCLPCKRRHVKCDETGPPCANCSIRDISCTYGPLEAVSGDLSHPTRVRAPERTGLPTRASQTPPSTAALELGLVHRWTTSTYISLCCIPEEYPLMQVLIPQAALRYTFLMDGIMALSALDIATNADHDKYPKPASSYPLVAAQYYDRALSAFRKLVLASSRENLDTESHLALFVFSLMAGVLNLAMPQCEVAPGDAAASDGSALASAVAHFDLLHGCGQIALIGMDWLEAGPVPTNARPNWKENVPFSLLDHGTKAAVARLHSLNELINTDDSEDAAPHTDPDESNSESRSERLALKRSISLLEEYFARTLDTDTKGFGILWPQMAGRSYAVAVKQSEPLALLLLMHWGVMLHRMARDYWWAGRAGKALVHDVEQVLRTSPHAALPTWTESVAWAVREVECLEGKG